MIKAEIIGDDQLVFKLQTLSDRMKAELTTAMTRITLQLVRYVQKEKLSGQVLKRRTGTLSRSIRGTVNNTANGITGLVDSRAGSGAPLSYAAFWEYGFTGTQSVRAHLRKTNSGQVNVRAHSRRVSQPARSFLRTSLAENHSMIAAEINAAIKKTTK